MKYNTLSICIRKISEKRSKNREEMSAYINIHVNLTFKLKLNRTSCEMLIFDYDYVCRQQIKKRFEQREENSNKVIFI